MTEDYVNRIAETAGIDKNELQKLIDKLHEMRAKREAYIRELQDKIHSQYYRCLAFEKRLSSTYEGTAKHEKLTHYLHNARKRFQSMRERLSGIRVDATNQQIATLLNIPKGTVDSALHYVREKFKSANVLGDLAENTGIKAS
jgi:CRP-like cAMP-binding protein